MKKSSTFLVFLFSITISLACMAAAPVEIDGIYPDSAFSGSTVIIKGHGFANGNLQYVWAQNIRSDAPPGFVDFNGARGIIKLWQDNLILVIVPQNATSGPVSLTLTNGISIEGGHFEIINKKGESTKLKGHYAFEDKKGMNWTDDFAFNRSGLYPSPYYFYWGYRPYFRDSDLWSWTDRWNHDGLLDWFFVSGPIFDTCGLFTGLDDIVFFPNSFYSRFNDRWNWWRNNFRHERYRNRQKGHYHFEE